MKSFIRKPIVCLFAVLCLTGCFGVQGVGDDPHPNIIHEVDEAFATPGNLIVSPSGDYMLVIESGYQDNVYFNRFAICLQSDLEQTVFTSDKRYRTRDRLFFCWDDLDNVWAYSGDTGMGVWVLDIGGALWDEQLPGSMVPPQCWPMP